MTLHIDWLGTAEGAVLDSRGAPTLVGLNQNVITPEGFPVAWTSSIFVFVTEDPEDLPSDPEISGVIRIEFKDPRNEIISVSTQTIRLKGNTRIFRPLSQRLRRSCSQFRSLDARYLSHLEILGRGYWRRAWRKIRLRNRAGAVVFSGLLIAACTSLIRRLRPRSAARSDREQYCIKGFVHDSSSPSCQRARMSHLDLRVPADCGPACAGRPSKAEPGADAGPAAPRCGAALTRAPCESSGNWRRSAAAGLPSGRPSPGRHPGGTDPHGDRPEHPVASKLLRPAR